MSADQASQEMASSVHVRILYPYTDNTNVLLLFIILPQVRQVFNFIWAIPIFASDEHGHLRLTPMLEAKFELVR